MTTTQAAQPTRADRLSDLLLVLIVLSVGVMAGAASFNHVHDWTMDNSPTGTPDWFGWANAVITELIPTAALIIVAKRRRNPGDPIGYPMFLLVVAVSLSLTAQLAVARPTVFGWMVSALPALAFFALSKLVFTTRKPATKPAPADTPTPQPLSDAADNTATRQPSPTPPITPAVPAHLIPAARFAVTNHEATTGHTITPGELAARMSIPDDTAIRLLAHLNPTPPATQPRVNGSTVELHTSHGGAR